MVVYLHYTHAIGMERLALLMEELFSLSISEGAICNILARARQPLLDATAAIEKVVLASPVVCSDETSVRVKGKNWWEWVFIGTLAVLHVIHPSRGKAVVTDLFGANQPEVWVSDMLGSQRGHACTVAGVPGASAARRTIRRRVRRYRLQRAVPVVIAARHGHRTPTRDAARTPP